MPDVLKAESSAYLEAHLVETTQAAIHSGESADTFAPAEHAMDFDGTTEQARKLCPYLGKLSHEEADRKIHDQRKAEAELDSFMDRFEAKQKEVVADKIRPQSQLLTVADTAKTVAKIQAENIDNTDVLIESARVKAKISKPESTHTIDTEVLGEEYRVKARRVAIEELTALHQRERNAIVNNAATVDVLPIAVVNSREEEQIIYSFASSEVTQKATEVLATAQALENEKLPVREMEPGSHIIKTEISRDEPRSTKSLELEVIQEESEQSEFVAYEEFSPVSSEVIAEVYEPLVVEIAAEVSEGKELVSAEGMLMPNTESETAVTLSGETLLTLEAEDAAKIAPSLVVNAEGAVRLEDSVLQTETAIDDYADGIEAQVSEIVYRAEAMQTVAELVETVEQLQLEIDLIQSESGGHLTKTSGEVVELIVDDPEVDTKVLVAKIEQLIERLVLLDKSDTVQDLVNDLLSNPALELLFENQENIEDRLKYLSERLGTREIIGTVHQTKSLLQRTVHYVHQLIGASTLNLYGLNNKRTLVTE